MKALNEHVQLRRLPVLFGTLSCLGMLFTFPGCATTPPTANEALPADLQANADEVLQEVVTSSHGDAVYICRRTAVSLGNSLTPAAPGVATDSTQLQWAETGSESMLIDGNGEGIGTVGSGYYFLAYDGSYVVGTPPAEAQVKPDTLAWARYAIKFVATPRPGVGRFANVSSIQRIDTVGGLPPQPECPQEGQHLSVPYTATYMIYRSKGHAPMAAATAD